MPGRRGQECHEIVGNSDGFSSGRPGEPCQSLGGEAVVPFATGETMTVAVNAITRTAVSNPEGPARPEGTAKVRVIIQLGRGRSCRPWDDDPTGWKVARELIAAFPTPRRRRRAPRQVISTAANDIRRYGVLLRALLDHVAHNAKGSPVRAGTGGSARPVRVQQTIFVDRRRAWW